MQETVNQEVTENSTQETTAQEEATQQQTAGTQQAAGAPAAGTTQPAAGTAEEKTFTQSEVNAMIAGRLARADESAKAELRKLQEELDGLKKADGIRVMRDKVSAETGVPASLLTGDTEEACRAQAEGIREYAAPKYPSVKDGGEVTANVKGSTRDQFAAWMEQNIH